MQYIPLVAPKDVAIKNNGKSIVLRIFKKYEFEMRKDTLEELVTLADFIMRVKHPTDWVTGGSEDMKKEESMELWPSDEVAGVTPLVIPIDDDPVMGAK